MEQDVVGSVVRSTPLQSPRSDSFSSVVRGLLQLAQAPYTFSLMFLSTLWDLSRSREITQQGVKYKQTEL
jgi:hypothetical protein